MFYENQFIIYNNKTRESNPNKLYLDIKKIKQDKELIFFIPDLELYEGKNLEGIISKLKKQEVVLSEEIIGILSDEFPYSNFDSEFYWVEDENDIKKTLELLQYEFIALTRKNGEVIDILDYSEGDTFMSLSIWSRNIGIKK